MLNCRKTHLQFDSWFRKYLPNPVDVSIVLVESSLAPFHHFGQSGNESDRKKYLYMVTKEDREVHTQIQIKIL